MNQFVELQPELKLSNDYAQENTLFHRWMYKAKCCFGPFREMFQEFLNCRGALRISSSHTEARQHHFLELSVV